MKVLQRLALMSSRDSCNCMFLLKTIKKVLATIKIWVIAPKVVTSRLRTVQCQGVCSSQGLKVSTTIA